MSDIWISAFKMIQTKMTDEEYIAIGKLVHQSLRERWDENQKSTAPRDKYGCTPYTEITVGTS
jgi:hypothetical protein